MAQPGGGGTQRPPLLAAYSIVKLGRTGASKRRILCIRSDVVAFLDATSVPKLQDSQQAASSSSALVAQCMSLPIKRIIPVPCVHSMAAYDGNKQVHLLIRHQHDAFFWKEDNSPVEDIVNILLKVTRGSGNPVHFTRDAGPIDPDEMTLDKPVGALTLTRRCDLRRAKSKVPIPDGPITLASWDAISSPLPFALDPAKMALPLQRAFAGMHIVMLGVVQVHPAASSAGPPVSRVLAFTPTRFIVCDEDSGREITACCLFSLRSISLNTEQRSVSLHLADEPISLLTFSFPVSQKASGAHVSDDVGVISNVVRFLLAREGIDVSVSRDGGESFASLTPSASAVSQPVIAAATSTHTAPATEPVVQDTSHAEVPVNATPPASPKSAVESPSLHTPQKPRASPASTPMSPTQSTEAQLRQVPDYQKPHGPIAQKFKSPQVLLARQVLRLTSKGAWEPRVVVITTQKRLIVCDEKTNVKRSVPLEHLDDICTVTHWEGHALALRIQGEHDLVLKLHPDCPKDFTIAHMVTVLMSQIVPMQLIPRKETLETKDRLRDILLRERPMKRGTTFVTPTEEVLQRRKSSMSPMAGTSTQPPSAAASPSPSRNESIVGTSMALVSPNEQPRSVIRSASDNPELELYFKRKYAAIVQEESSQRELLEAFEKDGALETLARCGDDERRAIAAQERRKQQEKEAQDLAAKRDADRAATAREAIVREERDQLQRLREAREATAAQERHRLNSAIMQLVDVEAKGRHQLRIDEEDLFSRTRREESQSRQLAEVSAAARRLRDTPMAQPRHARAPTAPPSPTLDGRASPQRDSEGAETLASSVQPVATTVMFKKELQLYTPSERSYASRLSSSPPPHAMNISGISASSTPYQRTTNRVILFPTPTSQALATRGADGSKNCFFRVKIGSHDAMAVVGSEKFATYLIDQLKQATTQRGSAAASLTSRPLLTERIICVSTDEPRVACGELSALLDILRQASLRGWIRRDLVMVRSTTFLWVELGTIPFAVAVERGETPRQIADKLLAGGSMGSAAPQ